MDNIIHACYYCKNFIKIHQEGCTWWECILHVGVEYDDQFNTYFDCKIGDVIHPRECFIPDKWEWEK